MIKTNPILLCVPRAAAVDFFEPLKQMPPLSHWPVKPEPYSNERSEVLAHIMALYSGCGNFATAQRVFDTARSANVVIYDKLTQRWAGNPFWRSNSIHIGRDDNVLDRYTAKEQAARKQLKRKGKR